jgi:hypothetical protein
MLKKEIIILFIRKFKENYQVLQQNEIFFFMDDLKPTTKYDIIF